MKFLSCFVNTNFGIYYLCFFMENGKVLLLLALTIDFLQNGWALTLSPWRRLLCLLATKVLMGVDDNSALIVSNPQGILGQ